MLAAEAWREPGVVYTAAILLAGFSAASELIGRFKDEPLKVLIGWPGLFYLAFNAGLSAAVLLILRSGSPPGSAAVAWEQVLLAGFGARVIVRTKIVGYRSKGGTEQDIGPGAVFEKVLAAISREADRGRAGDRLAIIRPLLDGVRFEHARPFFVDELVAAMQDLSEEEKKQINDNLDLIDGRTDMDEETRVDLLGYLILGYGGEDFLRQLVELYRDRFPEPTQPSPPPASPPSVPAQPGA